MRHLVSDLFRTARPALAVALAAGLVGSAAGCGPRVNCENLCVRTLACEVTFAPSDDVNGDKIKNGERTDEESCALGCEENPAVTVESAACVDDVTNAETDPGTCQEKVLACFGADVPATTD
jgi:hypothetical protein